MATTIRPSASATAFTFLDRKLEAPDVRAATILSHSTTNLSGESLPYWLVNVPPDRWPVECPSFLRDICEKNIQILSTPDEQYERQGWELVKDIIRECSTV